MHGLTELIGNPWFWGLVIGYFAFAAIVNGMPTPEEYNQAKGYTSIGYQWAFKSLRFFAGDLKSAFASKLPGQGSEAGK